MIGGIPTVPIKHLERMADQSHTKPRVDRDCLSITMDEISEAQLYNNLKILTYIIL